MEILEKEDDEPSEIKILSKIPENCSLCIKIEQMKNYSNYKNLNKKKDHSFFINCSLAGKNEKTLNKNIDINSNSNQDLRINWDSRMIFPLSQINQFLEITLHENNSLIKLLQMEIIIDDLKMEAGKLYRNNLILKEKNGKNTIELAVRFKIILEKEEELSLKIDRANSVLKNIDDYLDALYKFKYDLRAVIGNQDDRKNFEERNEYFDAFDSSAVLYYILFISISYFLYFLILYKFKGGSRDNFEKQNEMIKEKMKKDYEKNENQFDNEIDDLSRHHDNLTKFSEIEQKIEEIEKEIIEKEEEINEKNKEKEDSNTEPDKIKQLNEELKENNIEILNKKKLLNEKHEELKKMEEFIQLELGNEKGIVNSLEATNKELKYLEEKIKQLEQLKKTKLTLREQIKEFLTSQKYPPEDIKKIREYFCYLQKSVSKYYSKAVLIEADMFEVKTSAITDGVNAIAGCIPIVGNVLKFFASVIILFKKNNLNKFNKNLILFFLFNLT